MSAKVPSVDFSLDFPFAYGPPVLGALLKSENQHFIVHEQLGFVPGGEGEHLYLHVESDGDNTQWVAEQLAIGLEVRVVDIGFCGLKDRNAITRQWFSVYDPKSDVQTKLDLALERLPGSRLLEVTRGQSKLRRGQHTGNAFVITLLLDAGDEAEVQSVLERRLSCIREGGVPNYFGLQRFGRNGNNLPAFQQWLERAQEEKPVAKKGRSKRKPRGIILSAARSYLFNCILAERVSAQNWCCLVEGDVAIQGVPAGPLWGRGRSAAQLQASDIEVQTLLPLRQWADALEHLGLNQERRAFVSTPKNLQWRIAGGALTLSFELPPGEYATGVLREICLCREPNRHQEL